MNLENATVFKGLTVVPYESKFISTLDNEEYLLIPVMFIDQQIKYYEGGHDCPTLIEADNDCIVCAIDEFTSHRKKRTLFPLDPSSLDRVWTLFGMRITGKDNGSLINGSWKISYGDLEVIRSDVTYNYQTELHREDLSDFSLVKDNMFIENGCLIKAFRTPSNVNSGMCEFSLSYSGLTDVAPDAFDFGNRLDCWLPNVNYFPQMTDAYFLLDWFAYTDKTIDLNSFAYVNSLLCADDQELIDDCLEYGLYDHLYIMKKSLTQKELEEIYSTDYIPFDEDTIMEY